MINKIMLVNSILIRNLIMKRTTLLNFNFIEMMIDQIVALDLSQKNTKIMKWFGVIWLFGMEIFMEVTQIKLLRGIRYIQNIKYKVKI